MLYITNQGNANSTTMGYYLILIRMAIRKPPPPKETSIGTNAEKLEPLCITGGKVKCVAVMDNSIEVPQKFKTSITP